MWKLKDKAIRYIIVNSGDLFMCCEDKFKEDHTCKMCGCLMEHEHQEGAKFWLTQKDFACELCRMEYQDAFE